MKRFLQINRISVFLITALTWTHIMQIRTLALPEIFLNAINRFCITNHSNKKHKILGLSLWRLNIINIYLVRYGLFVVKLNWNNPIYLFHTLSLKQIYNNLLNTRKIKKTTLWHQSKNKRALLKFSCHARELIIPERPNMFELEWETC